MANVRRVAIAIKGGVSLGAYEAGVLRQTLDLIAHNNQNPAATKWYVDVLTGASAGAMTAAATAMALLAGADVTPANPFFGAWVRDVSVSALLPDSPTPIADNLFDAARLDQIAARNVRLPFAAPRSHAAFNRARPLHLSFALARLVTDPIAVPTWAGQLAYKEFADRARFALGLKDSAVTVTAYGVAAQPDAPTPRGPDHAVEDLDTAWRALVNAAIASGSFPLVFQPRCLRRWQDGGWVDGFFVDGGLYDNDPVGEAINLAHAADWADEHAADADRRFLVVHTEPSDLTRATLHPGAGALLDLPPLDALGKLAGGFVKEAQTSGLRGIGPINDAIARRFAILNQLALAVLRANTLPVLGTAVDTIAAARGLDPAQVAAFRRWLVPDLLLARDVQLEADPQRYARQLADNVDALPDPQKAAFTDLALFYDLATNLIDKVPLKPILIAPARNDLAGDPLYGFGGFFDQALRERDYQQGQCDAYQAWRQISDVPGEFDLTGAPPPPTPPASDTLRPENLRTYASELAKFKDRVRVVLDALSGDLMQGRGPLAAFAVQKLLGVLGDWAIKQGLAPDPAAN